MCACMSRYFRLCPSLLIYLICRQATAGGTVYRERTVVAPTPREGSGRGRVQSHLGSCAGRRMSSSVAGACFSAPLSAALR